MEVEEKKRRAAERAAQFIRSNMIVGLGTGSTVFYVLYEIAARIKEEDLKIRGIPTSKATEELARELSIPLTSLDEEPVIDITIDGADEVDPHLNLIKGAGGALLREKIVASNSRRLVIIVDNGKLVKVLGEKMPLPVEVEPFGGFTYEEKLAAAGGKPMLRNEGQGICITDSNNHIYDVKFDKIEDPFELEKVINTIPGVYENGLFLNMATDVVVAHDNKVEVMRKK